MTALTDFLFPAPAQRSVRGIIYWWESRRLKYNLIVGASGLLALSIVEVLSWVPPGRYPFSVPLPIIGVFGVMANVCYTFGSVVEVAIEKLWGRKALPTGPTLFRMGLTFSLGLTQLPTLLASFTWAFRVLRALF
jgi:hypothetical protein